MSKKGFTLVELLVVMSIISVLAAALIVSVPKVAERARDMKCKANLRNLCQAAQTYAIQNEHYPHAGPGETTSLGGGRVVYSEIKAWVGWVYSTGTPQEKSPWRKDNTKSHVGKKGKSGDVLKPTIGGITGFYSMTNGVLWDMVGKDTSTYLCPAFKKAAVIKYQESGTSELQDLWRSYVMNYRFHWHGGGGSAFFWHGDFTASWGGIQRSPETVLMFAEIQQPEGDQPFDTSEEGLDGKLDPEHDKEHIGFNHRVGKKNIAHVVFADGHVAVLLEPPGADGSSDTKLEELSLQLCNGEAIDKDLLN